MNKAVKLCVLSGLMVFLAACEETVDDGKINAPVSSKLEDAMYGDIVTKFENAGFTNVKAEKLDDLVVGWLTEDGEVEEVTIDGDTRFSTNSRYPADAAVIIVYHTFKKEEETDSEPVVEAQGESDGSEESSEVIEDVIITIDNNEEFATL